VQAAEYKTAQIRSNQIDQRLKPESGRGRDEEEIIGQLMISWPKRHTEPAGLLPQGTAWCRNACRCIDGRRPCFACFIPL